MRGICELRFLICDLKTRNERQHRKPRRARRYTKGNPAPMLLAAEVYVLDVLDWVAEEEWCHAGEFFGGVGDVEGEGGRGNRRALLAQAGGGACLHTVECVQRVQGEGARRHSRHIEFVE